MRTLVLALGLAALAGCTGIRPAGPLADRLPAPKPAPAPAASKAADPTPPPAVRPTPPTALVTPADVNPDNPHDAANKLTSELGRDSKAPTTGPVTVEVSRVKGGLK